MVLKVSNGNAYINCNVSIIVNGTDYSNKCLDYSFIEKMNQVPTFTMKVLGITTTELSGDFSDGNPILVKVGDALVMPKMIIGSHEPEDYIYGKFEGIGYGENLLYEKLAETTSSSASNSQAGRPFYEGVAANTIVSEQIATVSNISVNSNTVTRNINIRGENDNVLSFLAGVAELSDSEWYCSYSGTNFSNNYYNNVSTRGTDKSSTITISLLEGSRNAHNIKKRTNRKYLANYVKVFGYGDGKNQLESHAFHATSIRTTLSSDISSTATTIPLTDASSFPSSGSVWVGCEKISYTGKSGNSLTGCTRGVDFLGNVDEAYEHYEGTGVYDAQYTTSSPQSTGNKSSINVRGLVEKSFEDRKVMNQSALDILAEKILLERCGDAPDYKSPIIITFEVTDVIWGLKNLTMGDTITIVDSNTNINGTYRVYSRKLISESGYRRFIIEASNTGLDVIDEIKKANDYAVNLTKYMQGSTTLFGGYEHENAEAGTNSPGPIDVYFEIPEDTIRLNSLKLSYRNEKPRTWSNTTASGGGSTSGPSSTSTTSNAASPTVTSSSSSSSTTASGGSVTSNSSTPSPLTGTTSSSGQVSITSNYWTSILYGLGNLSGNSDWCVLHITGFVAGGTGISYFYIAAQMEQGGLEYYPNSTGIKINVDEYNDWSAGLFVGFSTTILIPENLNSQTLTIRARKGYAGDSNFDIRVNAYLQPYGSHSHNISSHTHGMSHTHTVTPAAHSHGMNHTHTIPAHTHTVGYDIATQSYTTNDVRIYTADDVSTTSPAWTERTSTIESAIGHSLDASEGGSETGIDIMDFYSGTGWKGLRFVVNGNSRHRIYIKGKSYIHPRDE